MPSYKKLVRDNIPDIIKAQGDVPVVRTLGGEEYLHALVAKLREETAEFAEAYDLAELADIQEVVLALAEAIGADAAALESARAIKAANNGTFSRKLFLENVN